MPTAAAEKTNQRQRLNRKRGRLEVVTVEAAAVVTCGLCGLAAAVLWKNR
jgi:hypothetical protein